LKATNAPITRDSIILDTGTSEAQFNDLKWFSHLTPSPLPMSFAASNGGASHCYYLGNVKLDLGTASNRTITVEIPEVYYNPDSPCNLLGRYNLRAVGISYNTDDDVAIHKPSGERLNIFESAKVPVFSITTTPQSLDERVTPIHAVLASINYRTMHRRLLHASKEVVLEACKNAGITLRDTRDDFCEPCIFAKMTDSMPKEATMPATYPIEFLRVDLIIHTTPGHLGYRYTIHFVDMISGIHWVRFAREKGEAFEQVKRMIIYLETQTSRRVRVLGLDGGTEFGQGSKEFQNSKLTAWAEQRGMAVWKTLKDSPWQNGKAERAGKEICTKATALMIEYGIPIELWPFVVDSVVRIMNLLPTKGNKDNKSPHQVFAELSGMPEQAKFPYIKHLRTYWCDSYYFKKPSERTRGEKFEAKARKAKLLGYGDLNGRFYWLWDPELRQVVRASTVKFNEKDDPSDNQDDQNDPIGVFFTDQTIQEIEEAVLKVKVRLPGDAEGDPTPDLVSGHDDETLTENAPTAPQNKENPQDTERRPQNLPSPPLSPSEEFYEAQEGLSEEAIEDLESPISEENAMYRILNLPETPPSSELDDPHRQGRLQERELEAQHEEDEAQEAQGSVQEREQPAQQGNIPHQENYHEIWGSSRIDGGIET